MQNVCSEKKILIPHYNMLAAKLAAVCARVKHDKCGTKINKIILYENDRARGREN